MSKKPSVSGPHTQPQRPGTGAASRSKASLIAGLLVALCVGIAVFAYVRIGRAQPDAAQPGNASVEPTPVQAPPPAPDPTEPPANAKFGPHKQAKLPPLPFTGVPPQRPIEVVAAAYTFAAEHPEVLGYIPCYCGCERGGHRGNDDCFVASRAANGDVTAWEPHGMT
jgi:hypothetical protein